jgi:hypothetical protein
MEKTQNSLFDTTLVEELPSSNGKLLPASNRLAPLAHRSRPDSFEQFVGHAEIFKNYPYLKEKNFPSIILFGPSGTGKTTLAKILVNDVLKCQYLYINASDENGVDTIRNKVISFSQTRSLDGKKKVIILDEFCGTTGEAQRILRNVMEEYASSTRFILTANYINKIIEPIQSRCILKRLTQTVEPTWRQRLSKNQWGQPDDYVAPTLVDTPRCLDDLREARLQGADPYKVMLKIIKGNPLEREVLKRSTMGMSPWILSAWVLSVD